MSEDIDMTESTQTTATSATFSNGEFTEGGSGFSGGEEEEDSGGMSSAQHQALAEGISAAGGIATSWLGGRLTEEANEKAREEHKALLDQERAQNQQQQKFVNSLNKRQLKRQEQQMKFNQDKQRFEQRLRGMYSALEKKENRNIQMYDSLAKLKRASSNSQSFRAFLQGVGGQ